MCFFKRCRYLALGFVLALFLAPCGREANAVLDTLTQALRLSGFGTLGYSWDDNHQLAAIRDITQRPEHLFGTDEYWKLDSRLGVQLDYRLVPAWEAIGQWVLRHQIANGLNEATELAYIAYYPTDHFDLRLGRMGLDGFMMSDHRNLGYAYDWVRPPQDFYSHIPFFFIDGIDIAYSQPAPRGRWRLKAQAGRGGFTLPFGLNNYALKANIFGLSLAREWGDWRVKGGLIHFAYNKDVTAFLPLYTALDQIDAAQIPQVSAEAAQVREDLTFNGGRSTKPTLGVSYDDGIWTAQAEVSYMTATRTLIAPEQIDGYFKLGRRVNEFTPFFMLRGVHPNQKLAAPHYDWGSSFNNLRDSVFYIANASRCEQTTFTLGMRWDFRSDAALKLQWDHTHIKPEGYAFWFRDGPINNQPSHINLWSLNLDFVF